MLLKDYNFKTGAYLNKLQQVIYDVYKEENGDIAIELFEQDGDIFTSSGEFYKAEDFALVEVIPVEVERGYDTLKIINLVEMLNSVLDEALDGMNEELEKLIFNEMSIAWNDREANRCVWVENPTGYNNKYFKYLNSFSYQKGKMMARISMLHPKYLDHKNMDGKKPWILTNKEKKELVKLMNQPSRDNKNLTNWQQTICQYNLDNFGIYRDETIDGAFNKKEFPNALDINTPMPNYLELP